MYLAACLELSLSYATENTCYSCATIKLSAHFSRKSRPRCCLQSSAKKHNSNIHLHLSICSRFIYPGLVSLLIASLYYPLGLGKFLAPTLTTRQQIISLFSNFSWINEELTVRQAEIVSHWTNDQTNMFNLFTGLGIYMITTVSHSS